jgi:hypothetical protein
MNVERTGTRLYKAIIDHRERKVRNGKLFCFNQWTSQVSGHEVEMTIKTFNRELSMEILLNTEYMVDQRIASKYGR